MRTIFMHKLWKIAKRMSERSEKVSLRSFTTSAWKKLLKRADHEVICLLNVYKDQFGNDTLFMHENVFITVQFLRNFVQLK